MSSTKDVSGSLKNKILRVVKIKLPEIFRICALQYHLLRYHVHKLGFDRVILFGNVAKETKWLTPKILFQQ